MLEHSGEVGYIHEPFLPARSPGWFPATLPYWYLYICSDNAAAYERSVEDLLRLRYPASRSLMRSRSAKNLALQAQEMWRSAVYRRKRLRPLLKDPLALFSSEWLAERFGVLVVVMIRHPVAFVGSIKRLNWGFDYERNWLAQDLLMRDLLGHRAEHYRGYQGEVDLVGEGIELWNSIYDVVDGFRTRHPEWLFQRYESLAADPVPGFKQMFVRLGLTWTEDVAARIAADNSAAHPADVSTRRRRTVRRDSSSATQTWRHRLTDDEVARVLDETRDVRARFYDDDPL